MNRLFVFVRTLPLLLTITGCTGALEILESAHPNEKTQKILRIGFADIRSRYIEDLNAEVIALSALEGLIKIDPKAKITNKYGNIILAIDGTEVGSVPYPKDRDVGTWAAAVTQLLAQGKKASTYLESAQPEKIYKAAFDAILGKLDKYSRYASREEARVNRATRSGFGGIGISIETHQTGVIVKALTPGMAADLVGVLVGDRIVAVEGELIVGLSLREVVSRIRGAVGDRVSITLEREGLEGTLTLTPKRMHIVVNTVFYEPRGESAYVRVTGFNRETKKRLKKALKIAQIEMGENINGIILDVRSNPGGLLDQAVEVADLFLTSGPIISTLGRHPKSAQSFDAKVETFGGGLPVVVLVNGTSASAAEILATALQDHSRAVIIGTTSYGKGTVQTVRLLPNDGELILTWARIYTPSGYALHRLGVLPTVCTSDIEDAKSALEKSLNTGAHFTRRDHASRRAADITDDNDAKIILSLCPWRPGKENDVDLDVAQRLLAQPALYKRAIELARPAAGT